MHVWQPDQFLRNVTLRHTTLITFGHVLDGRALRGESRSNPAKQLGQHQYLDVFRRLALPILTRNS